MGCFIMPKRVPNKRHTSELKKVLVETMLKEKLSYYETAKRFEASSDTQIRGWKLKSLFPREHIQ